ncbi:MAG: GrdX family protein [Negativicutes bacterium]|nr:GrdX family protein [Negativicutes bacterium]
MKKVLIITNNPQVAPIEGAVYYDETLLEILTRVRDLVHAGYVLISHPLTGSVKPNQTPYKSVILEPKPLAQVDEFSLQIIESSMATAAKLLMDRPLRPRSEAIKADYAMIDHSLLMSGLQSLSHF